MRLFTPRRIVALAALAPALFLFSAVPGCSNQGEGERCGDDIATNNDDCTAPLVCVSIDSSSHTNRCCDPNPSIVHDSRCFRSNNVGSGGSGATANTGGSGGSATAGTGGSGGSDLGGTGGAADLGGTGGIDASTAGMSSGGI